MSKKVFVLKKQIISILFILILGTTLHYTYNWSNENPVIGIFSAVNESTWEHLKLLYFPILITIILGKYYLKNNYSNYICLKTKGILSSFLFVIIFFYTYTGVIGEDIAFLNILSFIIAVIYSEMYVYKNINKNITCNMKLAIFMLFILLFSFIIFTFFPLQLGLFRDPVTGTFGI